MGTKKLAGKHMSKLLAMSIAAIMALSPVSGAAVPPNKGGTDTNTDTSTQNGTPSSKAATAINTVSVSGPTADWVDVMKTTIKTSNVSDLFVGVSLVTGLFTKTQVVGNGKGDKSTATAMGGVTVRVLLDGKPWLAYPDTTGAGVTFDQRVQTLEANLGFIFTECFATGGIDCTLTPEQITLVLETTSAHTYNFILLNVGSGVHNLTVQAKINTDATSTNGGVAVSDAMFGLGSLTVEAVRLVNGFSFD